MSQPVVVFRTHSDAEAAVVKGLLESQGLRAFLASDIPHAILPLSVNGLGEVRISVPGEEAEEAERVIAGFRRESLPGVVSMTDDLVEVEAQVEHRFRDRNILERALTHRSRVHEDGEPSLSDNESLEFLGDAILGFVVADLLYREFPAFDEGYKSKLKAALVSRTSLAAMADRMGLGAAMRLGRGEEKTGGRTKRALLANACEAVIAALYLDGGLDAVRHIVAREFGPLIEHAREPGLLTAMTGDYKSALQEFLQARDRPAPVYRVIRESGPDHRKTFEVEVWTEDELLGRAEGRTKKVGEQGAAREALVALGVLDERTSVELDDA